MDKLEFENFENVQEDEQQVDRSAEERAIRISNKILIALDGKEKEHNSAHPDKKVTMSQLRKVYRRGAQVEEEDKGLWAIARVNMFLRMKTGENVSNANKKNRLVRVDEFVDISASWCPSEKDFEEAGKDIEKYGLSNFNSVDELYIEDYNRVDTWVIWG